MIRSRDKFRVVENRIAALTKEVLLLQQKCNALEQQVRATADASARVSILQAKIEMLERERTST